VFKKTVPGKLEKYLLRLISGDGIFSLGY